MVANFLDSLGNPIFRGTKQIRRNHGVGWRTSTMERRRYVLNDPYSGGPSHLADVTFVSPVFCDGELIAFVANVGHWPDVGGKAPGQCSLYEVDPIIETELTVV